MTIHLRNVPSADVLSTFLVPVGDRIGIGIGRKRLRKRNIIALKRSPTDVPYFFAGRYVWVRRDASAKG